MVSHIERLKNELRIRRVHSGRQTEAAEFDVDLPVILLGIPGVCEQAQDDVGFEVTGVGDHRPLIAAERVR